MTQHALSHASESHGSGPGLLTLPLRNLMPSPRARLLPLAIIFSRERVLFKHSVAHMYSETASIQYMCWNERQSHINVPKFALQIRLCPNMTLVPIPEFAL